MARRNRKRKTVEQKREFRTRLVRSALLTPLRLLLLTALGMGIGFGAYQVARFMRTSPALAVRAIEVRGTVHSQIDGLLKAGGISEGMNIFSVDTAAVGRKLQDYPWVRRAHVTRVVPDRLVVEVEEYVPVAVINLEGLYYLDRQGEVFKRVQLGEAVDLPVITGMPREQFRDDPDRAHRRILDAFTWMETVRGSDCLEQRHVAEFHLDELMGPTFVLDPGAVSVRLGGSGAAGRLPQLCRVLAELERQHLQANAILLDQTSRPGWVTVQLSAAVREPNLLSTKDF